MKSFLIALGVAIYLLAPPLASAGAGVKNPILAPKSESIQGTLNIVSEDQKAIFVRTVNGVIYDFRISPQTRIEQAGRRITAGELSALTGKPVVVTFHALKTGNAALQVEFQ